MSWTWLALIAIWSAFLLVVLSVYTTRFFRGRRRGRGMFGKPIEKYRYPYLFHEAERRRSFRQR